MNFTLGLGQILVEGGAREANLRRAEGAIRELARQGADLVLLPEAMNLGMDPSLLPYRRGTDSWRSHLPASPTTRHRAWDLPGRWHR